MLYWKFNHYILLCVSYPIEDCVSGYRGLVSMGMLKQRWVPTRMRHYNIRACFVLFIQSSTIFGRVCLHSSRLRLCLRV